MGWSAVPVSAGQVVTAAQWNEVIAALNERLTAVEWLPLTYVSVGTPIYASKLIQLRNYTEWVSQYYFDPLAREVNHYYKASLLTQALGTPDWSAGVAIGQPVLATHLNELRLAINKLDWTFIHIEPGYDTTGEYKTGSGASYVGWDPAWALTLTDWGGASWADSGGNAVEFRTLAYYIDGGGWELWSWAVQSQRCSLIGLWTPNPSPGWSEARLIFNGFLLNDGGSGAGSATVYENNGFGGTSHTMAVNDYSFPGGPFFCTVSPTPGGYNKWSFQSNPPDPAPTDYKTSEVAGAGRGYFAQIRALSYRRNWEYHA